MNEKLTKIIMDVLTEYNSPSTPPSLPAPPPSTSSGTDTEFTCEVVRITEVLPHPNADRLEILHFETVTGPTAYDVISQKGNFAPGDLATYCSVDCIVPTDHEHFKFLTERLDGKGKTHYRLRAARLRGVFSQGLLIPAPYGAVLGQGCTEALGVTYHNPEVSTPGIPTAPSGKVQYQPWPIYSVESLKKVPRLFDEGEEVLVTEKIHGTNFRFGWVRRKFLGIPIGWKFAVGSHRIMKGDGKKGWYGEDLWLDTAHLYNLRALTKSMRGYAFYGEIFGTTSTGKKIQDLTYGQSGPGLVVFDIRNPDGSWMAPQERIHTVESLGLNSPPIVYCGPFHLDILRRAEGRSEVPGAHRQIREGIVVETTFGPRKKAKFVGEQYLTRKESE